MKNPNLIEKFHHSLTAPARELLDELLRIAKPLGTPLYLVGGPLRDLLLERPSVDIDIAVEGDAMVLARELAEVTGGRAATHPRFGTATIRIPALRLDLNTARAETYARPGALPTVRRATIREDLLRRDFTVNALALSLNGPNAGDMMDPTGGFRDLEAKLIRVLHERSFQDDATRIVRAFRYAARLGFAIEPDTLAWLKRDLRCLDAISGARLHHEFALIFAEDTPEDILLALAEAGALAAIHPALRFNRGSAEAFARLREIHPTGARAAYWPVLAWRLSEAEAVEVARRLALRRAQRAAVEAMSALREIEVDFAGPAVKRSAIAETFSPYPIPALWAFVTLADDPSVRERLLDYLKKGQRERPHLSGDDLLALGISPGPQLGEILRRLRNARLDGEVTSREDEKRLARALVAESAKADHHTRKAASSRSS